MISQPHEASGRPSSAVIVPALIGFSLPTAQGVLQRGIHDLTYITPFGRLFAFLQSWAYKYYYNKLPCISYTFHRGWKRWHCWARLNIRNRRFPSLTYLSCQCSISNKFCLVKLEPHKPLLFWAACGSEEKLELSVGIVWNCWSAYDCIWMAVGSILNCLDLDSCNFGEAKRNWNKHYGK